MVTTRLLVNRYDLLCLANHSVYFIVVVVVISITIAIESLQLYPPGSLIPPFFFDDRCNFTMETDSILIYARSHIHNFVQIANISHNPIAMKTASQIIPKSILLYFDRYR